MRAVDFRGRAAAAGGLRTAAFSTIGLGRDAFGRGFDGCGPARRMVAPVSMGEQRLPLIQLHMPRQGAEKTPPVSIQRLLCLENSDFAPLLHQTA